MCWLSKLFKTKILPQNNIVISETIPFPEENPDFSQTIGNVIVSNVINKWLIDYHVPLEFWDYWRTMIDIVIDIEIQYPAQSWEADGIRHIAIRPAWLNPGVIAHEQAHNSYALLGIELKALFSTAYTPLKTTDKFIKLLYSQNSYGLTSDIEGHAEVYRYLGNKMPDILKQYYPKLF